jgi:hypothetical protein
MKIISSAILLFGFIFIFNQITSSFGMPIIYSPHHSKEHNQNQNLDPAIVVTKPSKPIAIVPPPPSSPSPPPGPIDIPDETNKNNKNNENAAISIDIDDNKNDKDLPTRLVLPDGKIIYTPLNIAPFIV